MKASKREACEKALMAAGSAGVTRDTFEGSRLTFGTSFMRRLQEIEEDFEMLKFNDQDKPAGRHDFIKRWVLGPHRKAQPGLKLKVHNEVYIGTALGWDFFEHVPC